MLYDFDRYRKQKRTTTTSDMIDQLESYLSQDSFNVDDPLAYWNDKRSSGTWPELAQMALDYLTIPGESPNYMFDIRVLTSVESHLRRC